MRDRLINIIEGCSRVGFAGRCYLDSISDILADHLLYCGVIVPPCKVGEKVYYFSKNPLNISVQANTIYEADVVRIVTTHLGTSLVIQIRNEYGCTEIPDVNEWCKTVFLTKEEAKQALKGGEGK